MTYLLPGSSKKWYQSNSGDIFGNLYLTKNIDLSTAGLISLAKKPVSIYNISDSSSNDFGEPQAITYFPGNSSQPELGYHIVTNDEIWLLSDDLKTMTKNSTSGNPTTNSGSDGVSWQNRHYVSSTNNLSYWNGSAWTGSLYSTNSSYAHPLCVFESSQYLAVGDGNVVHILNTSHTLVSDVTIPSQYRVTWIRYKDSRLYFGTKNVNGANARLFVYSTGTAADSSFDIGSDWSFSGTEFDSSIVLMNSDGQLLRFNGGGFTQLAALPVYYTGLKWQDGNGDLTRGRVFQRGMVARNEVLYISVDGNISQYDWDGGGSYLNSQPSGLWIYDSESGLNHVGGVSGDSVLSTAISSADSSADTITLASTIDAVTGAPAYISTGTSIGGLDDTTQYFLIRSSSTVFQLSRTYADAINGVALNITSGISGGTNNIYTYRYCDYGNYWATDASAVALIPYQSSEQRFRGTEVLYGGEISPRFEGTEVYTIGSLVETYNRGWFVTTKMYSSNNKENWKKIKLKFKPLDSSDDKIIVKYRKTDYLGLPNRTRTSASGVCTWTSTSTFTVDSTYKDFSNVSAGDEIEIISGSGAGNLAHVSTISYSAPTYTVTLDEAIGGVTAADTSEIVAMNWIKAKTLTSSDEPYTADIPIGRVSTWLQIKIELRGKATTIEEIAVVNEVNTPNA